MDKRLIRRIKNLVEDNQLAYTSESVSGGMGNNVTSNHEQGYGGDYNFPTPAAGVHATVKNAQRPIEKIYEFLEKQEQRIYLHPGQQAPEGVQVKTGKRGAQYYIPTQGAKVQEQPAPSQQQSAFTQQPLRAANGAPIPPAWTDVWINPDPKAGVLAFGRDTKGRRVPLFSAEHRRQSHEQIFATLRALQPHMPMFRERLDIDKDSSDEAAVLYLITKTGFRVGSTKNTKAEKQAYGASTLLGKHVQIDGDIVTFDFIGKKGVLQHHIIEDADLAKLMKKHKKGDADRMFKTNGEKTMAYILGVIGQPFDNKDLRTWFATDSAINFIREMPIPKTKKEYMKQKKEVGEKVSQLLGNAPSEALQSYIAPEVFAGWEYPEENTAIQKSDEDNMKNLFEQVVYDEEIDWTKYNRDRIDDEKDADWDRDWYNIGEDIEKSKVYLERGAQAPAGKIVHTGKMGGKYYNTEEGASAANVAVEETPAHSPERIDDSNEKKMERELRLHEIQETFESVIVKGAEHVQGKGDWTLENSRGTHAMRKQVQAHLRDYHPMLLAPRVEDIRYEWQQGELMYEGCYHVAALFNIAAMMEKGMTYQQAKKLYRKIGPKSEIEKPYSLAGEFDEFFKTYKTVYDEYKKAVREIMGSGKIKIYRGCNGDFLHGRTVKAGDVIELDESIPLSRWTMSKSMADSFAKNRYISDKDACILEADVDIDDVWYIGPLFTSAWDYEFEVDIDHSKLKPRVAAVYEAKKKITEVIKDG